MNSRIKHTLLSTVLGVGLLSAMPFGVVMAQDDAAHATHKHSAKKKAHEKKAHKKVDHKKHKKAKKDAEEGSEDDESNDESASAGSDKDEGSAGGPGTHGFSTRARQAFMMDYPSGMVLYDKNGDQSMVPSSMTKMMTLALLFQALKENRARLDGEMMVSERAWRMGGSKTFLMVGKPAKVEDLIRGIIVQSGNDACVVVAEGLAGTEEAFAQEMNALAKHIGMTSTVFRNAHGMPDPGHMSTARDLAKLSAFLIEKHAQFYPYFAEEIYEYKGIKQYNRNTLLKRKSLGVDGIKTGHTEAGGYGIAISAQQNGRRLILVINGCKGTRERAEEAEKLLTWGFREFGTYVVAAANQPLAEAQVWLGERPLVGVMPEQDIQVTTLRPLARQMVAEVVYTGPIEAPLKKGQKVGVLRVSVPNQQPQEYPLVAASDVAQVGIWGRMRETIAHLLFGPKRT